MKTQYVHHTSRYPGVDDVSPPASLTGMSPFVEHPSSHISYLAQHIGRTSLAAFIPREAFGYTRHTSSGMYVGGFHLPESLTNASATGFSYWPRDETHKCSSSKGPTLSVVQNANALSCNANYFGYTLY